MLKKIKNCSQFTVLLIVLCSLLIISCDNSIMSGILPDRSGTDPVPPPVPAGSDVTLKLDPHNMGAGDRVSFAAASSLTTITAKTGANVIIYYSLDNTQTYNELVLAFGPVTGSHTVSGSSSSIYTYKVNAGDAVNGVIIITADFIHSNLIPLNPPVNVHFDQNGLITFSPGANNAAAGSWYTYTLYRDDMPVYEEPVLNATPSVIVSEMLSTSGHYTVKLKAHTTNALYTSESIESAHSEVVVVCQLTLLVQSANSLEKVSVTIDGNTVDYTATHVEHLFSGTGIILTAEPEAGSGRVAVWHGITGTGNTRAIPGIQTNTTVTVTFTNPSLVINTPSAIEYNNNYKNRNALTPFSGEHNAAFTVGVSGFLYDTDAYNVTLNISSVAGLTITGHNTIGNAVNGTKTFTINVNYNGTASFTSIINSAQLIINVTASTIPSGYPTGIASQSININIIDGQHIDRPIPVNQSNITIFRAYAVTAQGNAGKNYKQVEDISSGWTTITGTFNSNYNGGGFTVSNFTGSNGLFTTIGVNGVVQNLGVSGSINATGNSVGGIAGTNQGRIINCHSNVSVSGNQFVGGIAGNNNNNGFVKNCFNTGNVSGNTYVGGIVGYNNHYARVEECYNIGTITGGISSATVTQWWGIGGIVGEIVTANGVVTNCYNAGNVFGNDHTGGVVGTSRGEVSNCYNIGYVSYVTTDHRTSSGGSGHGGVLGNHYLATGSVKDSVSLGLEVNGNSNNNGRVVGYIANNSYIINLKARADLLVGRQGVLNTVTGTASNSIHGEDVAIGTSLATVFNGWDTITDIEGNLVWEYSASGSLTIGGSLPTLRNTGGTQNPVLQ